MEQAEIDALAAIFAEWRNHGMDRLVKALRRHPFSEGAAALLKTGDKRAFDRNAGFMVRCDSGSAYAGERMVQLVARGVSPWV